MKIVFGTDFDSKMTYQEYFPETLDCNCGTSMYPIVQIADDEGMIARRKPPGAKHWIGDSAVIVVYQCHNCMELRAIYNQG